MSTRALLGLFAALRLAQLIAERGLARLNRRYYLDPERQAAAGRTLGISDEALAASIRYATDRSRLATVSDVTMVVAVLAFIAVGGLGRVEIVARSVAAAWGCGSTVAGLVFLGVLALASALVQLPFDAYATFVIEQRHGFNRQSVGDFILDRLKGAALSVALGAPLIALVLALIERAAPGWWVAAWLATNAVNLIIAWIYPTLLAPLFNRFTPLPEGDLRVRVLALCERVGFRTSGVFVMDGSRRSTHGNAFFTGLFGHKRIVLFDTLVEALLPHEIVAVLAHELGHFKLHHVRRQLARSLLFSAVLFFTLSRCLPLTPCYVAFGLAGRSAYGALVVFGLWFALVEFLLQPWSSAISRRHEFAADAFALRQLGSGQDLGHALLKLRERSRHVPLVHPLYSRIYYSHPPLLERLAALGLPGERQQAL